MRARMEVEMKQTTLAVALALAGAAPSAHAIVFDTGDGVTHTVPVYEGVVAHDTFRTSDGRVTTIEVRSQGLPIRSISHSTAGIVVHAGAGGAAPLTAASFRTDLSDGTSNTILVSELRTGATRRPSALRTIALDPSDPGAELLDAGHVALPGGALRAWAFVRRSSGQGLLVDYDVAGGAVRRTPLGFTVPSGSTKGSLVAKPNGEVWGTFATASGLFVFSDLLVSSVVAPTPRATLALGAGFVPGSTHTGIIAILIGLFAQPTPAVSYQVGDEVLVGVPDGGTLRTIARATLPPGAEGFMEDEGLFSVYFILPYVEQDNVYRQVVGGEPEVWMTIPR